MKFIQRILTHTLSLPVPLRRQATDNSTTTLLELTYVSYAAVCHIIPPYARTASPSTDNHKKKKCLRSPPVAVVVVASAPVTYQMAGIHYFYFLRTRSRPIPRPFRATTYRYKTPPRFVHQVPDMSYPRSSFPPTDNNETCFTFVRSFGGSGVLVLVRLPPSRNMAFTHARCLAVFPHPTTHDSPLYVLRRAPSIYTIPYHTIPYCTLPYDRTSFASRSLWYW